MNAEVTPVTPVETLSAEQCREVLRAAQGENKLRALVGFLRILNVAEETSATGKAEADIRDGQVKRLSGPYHVKVAS